MHNDSTLKRGHADQQASLGALREAVKPFIFKEHPSALSHPGALSCPLSQAEAAGAGTK